MSGGRRSSDQRALDRVGQAEQAQRVIDAFEEAEGSGSASIQVDGRFVDYPIYDRARQKLRLHRAARADHVG